jgi:hypothetical protein
MEELQISEGFKRSSKGEEQTSPYRTMGGNLLISAIKWTWKRWSNYKKEQFQKSWFLEKVR